MMRISNSYNAYKMMRYSDIVDVKQLSIEDRKEFLGVLFNTVDYAMEFLTDKHYINEEEKDWALRIALRSPEAAAKLYSNYQSLLSPKQLQEAYNTAFDKWGAIRILFKNDKLTEEQRIDAIKRIRISSDQCEMLIANSALKENELELILEYQITSRSVLKAIIRFQTDSVIMRKKAFEFYARNVNDIFDAAKEKYFNPEELKIVHDIFWGEIYEERKRTYNDYLQYCEIFMPVLNDIELDNLVKRLIAYKRRTDIRKFFNLIPEEYALKLDGFLVAEKLRGK